MEIKTTYIGTMISLATVAFGLLAAGAWNKAITDLFGLFLKSGSNVWAEIAYAIVVTILAVVIVQNLGKLASREIGPRA
jgi:uncharacterized membrane protein YidH (DUF202 family)